MSKRKGEEILSPAAWGVALTALLALCFWLTSLNFGGFRPESPAVTFVLWALSTCVVFGTIALGFMLFRSLVKLYFERRANKLGSRIRTKLVCGMLALAVAPIALHLHYSIVLLNRNVDKWFSQRTVEVLRSAERLMERANQESVADLGAVAERLAAEAPGEPTLAVRDLLRQTRTDYLALRPVGTEGGAQEVTREGSSVPESVRAIAPGSAGAAAAALADGWICATARLPSASGFAVAARRIPGEVLREQEFMRAQVQEWQQLEAARPVVWRNYAYILALITIFMLFIAVWLAQFASKLIVRPIRALVTATDELAGGHLAYRIKTAATDELAALVDSFNSMSQALEGKTSQLEESNHELARANAELEERRRLINAILESIKPGVVSVDETGRILKFNESARLIAQPSQIEALQSISELLHGADRSAFEHMFSSARRTGVATRDFEVERRGRPMHLNVTVSSLDSGQSRHGFVVVLEDTTELMRAQRSEAWQEVARRVAHEIKNPLTPVALAAGRIDRLLDRLEETEDSSERAAIRARLAQSTRTIDREVQSLRALVDSFSDLARFPSFHPESTDLNGLARDAAAVFEGRLSDVRISVDPDPDAPPARVDPEPFKRAVINLIDNAAEVLQDCWVKEIVVSVRATPDRSGVELTVADSGPGISPENKQRLFQPYFSTKERGTGLGLSIVRSIVQDHHGTIRVENNQPSGSRFVIEVPAISSETPELQEVTA